MARRDEDEGFNFDDVDANESTPDAPAATADDADAAPDVSINAQIEKNIHKIIQI